MKSFIEFINEAKESNTPNQIADLLSSSACQGIHVYVMNNAYVAKKITQNVSSLIDGINNGD